ncbi:MAG: hypothetical protein GYA50_03005 [Eubacteriaceae bacterium]|nr:hypothetical protein [Eubacteriaceae bacterium]
MKDLSYTIDCRGRLFVFAPMTEDFIYEYRGDKWTAYQGLLRSWLESEPISEDDAMQITAGMKFQLN